MAGEFLLDTNIVSAALDGDPNVWAEIVSVDQVTLPSIVVGELLVVPVPIGASVAVVGQGLPDLLKADVERLFEFFRIIP